MSDTDNTTPPAPAPEGQEPQIGGNAGIRILAQFIRDLSFENPRAPDVLRQAERPQLDMNVEMNARGRVDGLFEVDLKLGCKAMQDNTPVFQVELVYGGLFAIEGVADQDVEPVLLIECPRYLFPFARRIISDLTTEGGFPPFMIDPLDFGAIYAQRQMQANTPAVGQA